MPKLFALVLPTRSNRSLHAVARVLALLAAPFALCAQPASAQTSPESNDQYGFAVASGDFDGDGFDDLAIGVPNEGIAPSEVRGGIVEVHYGPDSGVIEVWHQDVAGISGAVESGDQFGHSLAAGDFDGDGFDDLAIAAPYEEVDGQVEAGMVHVLYGTSGGLSASGSQSFHQNSSGIAGTASVFELFGFSLAAGDFGKDGADDLAIGVPGETINDTTGGAVAILYGTNSTGLSSTGNQLWHQDSSGIPGTHEPFDTFGYALAAGNFGFDGRDDLAIGNPSEDIGSVFAAGAVWVIYGTSTGLTSANSQGIDQDSPFMPNVPDPSDNLGYALAAGRFGASTFDALVIGVPGESDDMGIIHVLHGGAGGLGTSNVYAWNTGIAGVPGTPEAGDRWGASLATGDFNDDARDDLAIGAPGEAVGAVVGAGAISVLYSSNGALGSAGSQIWDQDTAGIEHTVGTNDQYGFALCSGDFDGDGVEDLLVGVPYEDTAGRTNDGAAFVIEGRLSSGLTGNEGRWISQ